MSDLIVYKPYSQILRTHLRYTTGKLVSYFARAYDYYRSVSGPLQYSGERMPKHLVNGANQYVIDIGSNYRDELDKATQSNTLEETSQYYNYRYIEETNGPHKKLSICNIGALYCAADVRFLEKNPGSEVHALDFGDLHSVNANILRPGLNLHSGYPLETLERLVAEGNRDIFDYAMFARTAFLFRSEELFSYMNCLNILAKKVIFLELCKTVSMTTRSLDISRIPLDRPTRIINEAHIHNYPAVLNKYGYEVKEAKILPHNAFQQKFVKDHYFIFAVGHRSGIPSLVKH